MWDQNCNAIYVFAGCDCCCGAKIPLCSLSCQGTCVFQWVIVQINLFGQWIVYLPARCLWNWQLSEGGSHMSFDTWNDIVKLLFLEAGFPLFWYLEWQCETCFVEGGSPLRAVFICSHGIVNYKLRLVKLWNVSGTVNCELWNYDMWYARGVLWADTEVLTRKCMNHGSNQVCILFSFKICLEALI